MDIESEKMFLQNLEEYIFDEKKVVTCKWLSSTFSLHINAVRQLIEQFLLKENVKKYSDSFKKTYYVSGIPKDGKGMVSSVVREEDLAHFKDNLSVVISEHLYSIQKGGTLQDLTMLCMANQHDDNCKGIIKNDLITKRSTDELAKLRVVTYPKPGVKPQSVYSTNGNSKPSSMFSNNKDQIKKEKNSQTKAEVKKEVAEEKLTLVTNNKSKKNAGIAGFFSKQTTNSMPKIENMKLDVKPVVENNVKKDEVKVKKENFSPKKNSIKEEIPSLTKSAEKIVTKKEKQSPENSKSNKGNISNAVTKKKVNKKDAGKKRKRIQTLDSESDEESKDVDLDDIFSSDSPERVEKPQLSDEDEDVIPPTPEVKVNKAPLNHRKRKKVVDKTFMDENGYIITKKEEVYESCSEKEDEDPKVENVPINNVKVEPKLQSKKTASSPPTKKKKTSPQGHGKQKSLMSFFKKV